jgi:hypothetical protein
VNTFPALQIQEKGLSSEFYPKPSKEVQATLHGTPFLQSTQITQIIQRGKRIIISPPEIFHSAKSSGPLSHNHLHKHTSDLQQFEIYQDAIK